MNTESKSTTKTHVQRYLHAVFPPQPFVSTRERWVGAAAALVGVLLLGLVSSAFSAGAATPFLIASMGASAVLLFATPHSPLAQPWAFAAGHLLAAVVGVMCARAIPNVILAAAVSVSTVIVLMHFLRCLHPPAGGTALLPLLSAPEHAIGFDFVLAPVGLNVGILLVLALIINRLVPGRRYPSPHFEGGRVAGPKPPGWPLGRLGLSPDDLVHAMKEMNTYIDVSEEDLEELYARAELRVHRRRMGEITCRDIMTREVTTAQFGDELDRIWDLMRARKLKGVPVVDRASRIEGIVTIVDFLKRVNPAPTDHLFDRMVQMIRRTPDVESGKPEVVGQIMTSPAVTIPESEHIVSLIPLFAEHGIHHVPVVDATGKLVGMITQSDLVAALYRYRTERPRG